MWITLQSPSVQVTLYELRGLTIHPVIINFWRGLPRFERLSFLFGLFLFLPFAWPPIPLKKHKVIREKYSFTPTFLQSVSHAWNKTERPRRACAVQWQPRPTESNKGQNSYGSVSHVPIRWNFYLKVGPAWNCIFNPVSVLKARIRDGFSEEEIDRSP